jgi:hypothetical protein
LSCGYANSMSAKTNNDGPDLRDLWLEGLWGLGLIGVVLAFLGVLVVAFGR